ncbi:MAG TPA: sigma-70 family RNA polymerase sigma factor [Gaiellales bacterium]|jgi:RNA polymerase sigma-70 factor (ECF subfamily)
MEFVSESDSARRAGAGRRAVDVADIESVYVRTYPALVRVCAATLEDGEEALEAVQEGFAVAIQRRAAFRGEGSLDGWVWRVVVNAARTRQRRRVGRMKAEALVREEPPGVPRDAWSSQEFVRDFVRTLPERQRLVLFLRYFSGLDYREIAQVADIAVGTVSATLNAAHESLRRAMEEAED